MENNQEKIYKLVTMFLAPAGSYYTSRSSDGKWTDVYACMYVSVWQDQEGMVYNIPLWSEELEETIDFGDDNIQDFVERRVHEHRKLKRRMTCSEFLDIVHGYDADKLESFLDTNCDDMVSGDIATTPELHRYLLDGDWRDLRTLDNDGTLRQGWEEKLTPDGLYPEDNNMDLAN